MEVTVPREDTRQSIRMLWYELTKLSELENEPENIQLGTHRLNSNAVTTKNSVFNVQRKVNVIFGFMKKVGHSFSSVQCNQDFDDETAIQEHRSDDGSEAYVNESKIHWIP